MKRLVLFSVLFASIMGALATLAPASADAHKDRFRRDCATGARKC